MSEEEREREREKERERERKRETAHTDSVHDAAQQSAGFECFGEGGVRGKRLPQYIGHPSLHLSTTLIRLRKERHKYTKIGRFSLNYNLFEICAHSLAASQTHKYFDISHVHLAIHELLLRTNQFPNAHTHTHTLAHPHSHAHASLHTALLQVVVVFELFLRFDVIIQIRHRQLYGLRQRPPRNLRDLRRKQRRR